MRWAWDRHYPNIDLLSHLLSLSFPFHLIPVIHSFSHSLQILHPFILNYCILSLSRESLLFLLFVGVISFLSSSCRFSLAWHILPFSCDKRKKKKFQFILLSHSHCITPFSVLHVTSSCDWRLFVLFLGITHNGVILWYLTLWCLILIFFLSLLSIPLNTGFEPERKSYILFINRVFQGSSVFGGITVDEQQSW